MEEDRTSIRVIKRVHREEAVEWNAVEAEGFTILSRITLMGKVATVQKSIFNSIQEQKILISKS